MHRLLKTLNLREGEVRLFSLSAIIFFLISFGVILGKSVRDSLFLSYYGVEKLPYMYIFAPFFVIVASAVVTRYVIKKGEILASFRIMTVFSIALVALTPVVYVGYTLGYPLIFAGMYIIAQVILAIEYILFWWVAVRSFDSRQAKRLFPLIIGGGMIAAAIAGLSIRFLVEAVTVEWIFLLWAVLVFIGGFFYLKLAPFMPQAWTAGKPISKKKGEMGEMWDLIRKSKLLRYIIATALLMWTVSMLVDFAFKSAVTAHYGGMAGGADPVAESAMIASFLGLFQGIISVLSLLVQIFVTARIISMIGVGSSPLVYSLGMMLSTFVMWLSSGVSAIFYSAVGAKFTDEMIQGTIDQADSHLRYNGLAEKDKGRAHTFVSGAVKPVSGVIAGVSLVCLSTVAPAWITGIAFALSVLWLVISFRVRRLYIDAMVENLMSGDLIRRVQAREALSESRDPRAVKIIERALGAPEPQVCIFALELVKAMGLRKLPPSFESCFLNGSAEVKKASLDVIESTGSDRFLPHVAGLLGDDEPSVVARAISVLSEMKKGESLADIYPFIHSREREIQSVAIIALVKHGTRENREQCRKLIDAMLSGTDERDRETGAYVLGELKTDWFADKLVGLLQDESPSVRSRAATALGLLGDVSAIPVLLEKLADRAVRGSSIRALMNLANVGRDELARRLFDKEQPPELRMPLPSILARSDSEEVTGILLKALEEEDPALRRSLLAALHSIIASGERSIPDYTALNDYIDREMKLAYLYEVYRNAVESFGAEGRFILLLRLVEDRGRTSRERLFRGLGLIYHFQTVMSLYWKLSSLSRRAKADSLEAVEGKYHNLDCDGIIAPMA